MLLTLSFGSAEAWATAGMAPTTSQVADGPACASSSAAPRALEPDYAARERNAKQLETFRRGDVVVIGGITVIITLLVVLIVVVV